MKKSTLILGIIILIGCISSKSMSEDAKGDSFSFEELELAPRVSIPPLQYIEADDKVRLAYREYVPEKIDAVLIFYHGGGTYCTGGYEFIGDGLSKRSDILVVTPDIRGHGDSGGERGDTPSVEQVFKDVGTFIRHVRARYPEKALFLGGHSSGGGLVLNYSSYNKREKVQGYLFLSPQLGFRSKTEFEDNPNPFTTVKTDLFVKNAMSGTHGNSKAVFFNYSKECLQKTKNIAAITVNMANAITPISPVKQIQELDQPTGIWIGEKDELFDPAKVVSIFKENNPECYTNIIGGEKHLSILINASNYMGPWIREKALEK